METTAANLVKEALDIASKYFDANGLFDYNRFANDNEKEDVFKHVKAEVEDMLFKRIHGISDQKTQLCWIAADAAINAIEDTLAAYNL